MAVDHLRRRPAALEELHDALGSLSGRHRPEVDRVDPGEEREGDRAGRRRAESLPRRRSHRSPIALRQEREEGDHGVKRNEQDGRELRGEGDSQSEARGDPERSRASPRRREEEEESRRHGQRGADVRVNEAGVGDEARIEGDQPCRQESGPGPGERAGRRPDEDDQEPEQERERPPGCLEDLVGGDAVEVEEPEVVVLRRPVAGVAPGRRPQPERPQGEAGEVLHQGRVLQVHPVGPVLHVFGPREEVDALVRRRRIVLLVASDRDQRDRHEDEERRDLGQLRPAAPPAHRSPSPAAPGRPSR